jgi:hypothetical protein
MAEGISELNYDELIAFMEQCHSLYKPKYVIARSVEDAEAFAYWCVENGIEEPEIAILTNG